MGGGSILTQKIRLLGGGWGGLVSPKVPGADRSWKKERGYEEKENQAQREELKSSPLIKRTFLGGRNFAQKI